MSKARSVRIGRYGGYDVLEQAEIALPQTSKHSDTAVDGTVGYNIGDYADSKRVVVDTVAAGVNYADVCIRWGLYESAKKFVGLPIVPGFEFSGVVRSVGADVAAFKEGDHVFGATLFGGYSTRVVVPDTQLFHLPRDVTFEQAAGLPAVLLTAYYALFELARPRVGSAVLIHSAAGGVGTALTQLARIAGCRVVGVVGRSHKVGAARDAGCHEVIDKSTEDLWKAAERHSPEGYHAVFDANGVATLQGSFNHLAATGKLVVYGFHSMLPRQGGKLSLTAWAKIAWDYIRTPSFSPLSLTTTNKSVMGFNLSFLASESEFLASAMARMLGWIEGGQLRPLPITVFAMSDVAEAHKAIESGKTVGKLILRTGGYRSRALRSSRHATRRRRVEDDDDGNDVSKDTAGATSAGAGAGHAKRARKTNRRKPSPGATKGGVRSSSRRR